MISIRIDHFKEGRDILEITHFSVEIPGDYDYFSNTELSFMSVSRPL